MRVPIWPGVRLTVWEKQNPNAVKVTMPTTQLRDPVRRVLSKRGWMLLLVRYDWRKSGRFFQPESEIFRVVPDDVLEDVLGCGDLQGADTPENGAWHTVWLEGKWSWVTSRMTTPQREYAADRVAAYSRYLATCDRDLERGEPEGLRWWREDDR